MKINGIYKEISIEHLLYKSKENNISVNEIYIKKGKKYLKVRLVAFKLPEEKANMNKMQLYKNAKQNNSTPKRKSLVIAEYSIYITNAHKSVIADNMIRNYYRLRWNVELIFKSFKSVLQIHRTNVRNNHNRLKCELYARLILVAIVHRIHSSFDRYLWGE